MAKITIDIPDEVANAFNVMAASMEKTLEEFIFSCIALGARQIGK